MSDKEIAEVEALMAETDSMFKNIVALIGQCRRCSRNPSLKYEYGSYTLYCDNCGKQTVFSNPDDGVKAVTHWRNENSKPTEQVEHGNS